MKPSFDRFGAFARSMAMAGMIASSVSIAAGAEMITSHGISTFGELKYEQGFPHLDYVNPDAPKGGEISVWGFGSFDSMHPYTTKGRSGQLSSMFFESLLDSQGFNRVTEVSQWISDDDIGKCLITRVGDYDFKRDHIANCVISFFDRRDFF